MKRGKKERSQGASLPGLPLHLNSQCHSVTAMDTERITLKLMVDEGRNRVVFAESDGQFVATLLSFLTLPLGTIIKLADKPSSLGCIDKLYESVERLGTSSFNTDACKSMLLHPVNSAALKCRKLSMIVEGREGPRLYVCERRCCSWAVSAVQNARCPCGSVMAKEAYCYQHDVLLPRALSSQKGRFRFLISDDWVIAPFSTANIFSMLGRVGIKDSSNLDEREVQIGQSDVLRLLKNALLSETTFTNVFLSYKKESIPMETKMKMKPRVCEQPRQPGECKSKSMKISIKLVLTKNDNNLLYAEVKEDFIDLLFSFLTIPLGFTWKQLGGNSNVKCFDNLYKSLLQLSTTDYIKNRDYKEMLINPKLPPHFRLTNQLIKVEEEAPGDYYMCTSPGCNSSEVSIGWYGLHCPVCESTSRTKLKLIDPKVANACKDGGGYLRRAMYIVTDDLVAMRLSSVVVVSHLERAQQGVEETLVDIGEEEALALLQASATSKTVLTDVFLADQIKKGGQRKRKKLDTENSD